MKRITRWFPDTCSCILEYEWDDAQDENTRTHTFTKVIQRCQEHERLVFTEKSLYDQVLSENTRKNLSWSLLKTELSLADSDVDKFVWWFDNDRVLQVTVLGITLTTAQKTKLQNASDKQFMANKVKVL